MTLDDVILELYRLAETKEWDGKKSDEALTMAIEGMEQIWSLRQADHAEERQGAGPEKTAALMVLGRFFPGQALKILDILWL